MRTFQLLVALAAAVTPVEKVVSLLGKLQSEIQAEGAKEAANYDKFACFCKESADEKLYVINNAKKAVTRLAAEIEQLDTEIAALAAKTAEDKQTIAGLETDSENAVAARAAQHATYVAEEKDLAGAIDAAKRAIEALSASKEQLSGAKLQLLARDAAQMAELLAISKVQFKAKALKALKALLQAAPGEAHVSEYHSNDIIAMIQELKKTFIENKRTLDTEEADNKQAHNMEEQARQYQIKTLNDQVAEQQKIEAEKSEERAGKQAEKDSTQTAQNQDQAFLDELTSTCEGKATEWDKRSSTRADELKAISEAMELLKGQVSDNYSANKKLVGLSTKSVLRPHAVVVDEDEDEAEELMEMDDAAFLQLSPRQQIQRFLEKAAKKLNSKAISQLVLQAKIDHFVKVRGLVKDLIARLEQQAEAEATQKQWCDDEMSAATTKRDENQAEVEKLNGQIVSKEAKIERLGNEITALSEDIAALNKELNERTILREEESKENARTVSDATEGLDAVTQAIDILRNFYNNAFIQKAEPWRPANADSAGNTVGDVAPATFEDGYHGKQDSSKGIIGILEVIKADFDRTISATEQAESDANTEFETYKTETNNDIDAKTTDKGNKETERVDTNDAKTLLEDDRADSQTLLDEAKKELAELAPACVETGMSWEERSARREQEVNSLKEALEILNGLDLGKGFMQKF